MSSPNELERKVPRRCRPPCEACGGGASFVQTCLNACIGHKLDDIRFVFPPPMPSRDVLIDDLSRCT